MRQPFDVSGVQGNVSLGSVVIGISTDPTAVATGLEATASVGSVVAVGVPSPAPLIGTTGLGNVTVIVSDVDVPVGG